MLVVLARDALQSSSKGSTGHRHVSTRVFNLIKLHTATLLCAPGPCAVACPEWELGLSSTRTEGSIRWLDGVEMGRYVEAVDSCSILSCLPLHGM